MTINFPTLADDLLARARTLLPQWLPEGRFRGHEFQVGSLGGERGESLSINVNTGRWSDFASGEKGGDLISLYAAMHRLGQAEAARELGAEETPWRQLAPAPAKPREPESTYLVRPAPGPSECRHPKFGAPLRVWDYRDDAGQLLGHVARYEPAGERKQIVPWIWAEEVTGDGEILAPRWHMKQFPDPRPLYGLDRLAARPEAPVLIPEGEKAADAAASIAPIYVAVTWPGGAKAWRKADFRPLVGRKVLLWPDADAPGIDAMREIAQHLIELGAAEVKVIDPTGQPEGWDAADALAEGWDWRRLRGWAKARVAVLERPPPDGPPPAEPDDPGSPPPDGPDSVADLERAPWGGPVDLFGRINPPAVQAEWLPGALGQFVFEQSDLVGTDPGIIAMAAIVCCAATAHDGHRLQPKRRDPTWTESPRLWGAMVGDPSTKKSPGVGKATGPLRKIDLEMAELAQQDLRTYELQKKIYTRDETEWVKKGQRSGESPPDEPQKPPIRRLMVEDITVEALSEILVQNPRGVLCFQDELSGWFGAMDAYNSSKTGGKDRAHWLEIYNGGPRRIDRIGRGSILIPNWSACVLGGIQPDAIRGIKAKLSDDGLLQRFMVVMGRPAHGGVDREPNMPVINAYKELIRQLHAFEPADAPFVLSPEAAAIREEVAALSQRLVSMGSIAGGLRSVFGKWDGLFARLLLTFWLVEWAGLGQPPERVVDGSTAARVRDFMVRYLLPHTLAFYTDVLDSGNRMEHVRQVARYVLAKGGDTLTTRDLIRYVRAWSEMQSHEQRAVLEMLEHAEWIRPAEARNNYRTGIPTRWEINPAVHKVYQEEAEIERKRRNERRSIMAEIRSGFVGNVDNVGNVSVVGNVETVE